MSKELVIGSNRHETKVAVLEEDQLVEVYFQRGDEYSLAGSIHKGRVTRVLPGMQSAFVDLGLERDTFLYVSDFFEENEDIDTVSDEKPSRSEGRRGDERFQREDRRDRGQGRTAERPSSQQGGEAEQRRLSTPVSSNDDSAEASPAAETRQVEERILGASDVPPSEAAPKRDNLPEQRAAQREGDRPFRGGDRRGGRRSRRKPQGRGFPDNKYAQPSGTSSVQQDDAHPVNSHDDQAKSDVLILPGESLAKYRHSEPPALLSESVPPIDRQSPDDGEGFSEQVFSHEELDETPAENILPRTEPDEDIEAQADEIEFTDRVFGHNGEDDIPPEDEDLFKANDEIVPAFHVGDIEPGEEEHVLSPGKSELRQVEPLEEMPYTQHPAMQHDTSADVKVLPIAEETSPSASAPENNNEGAEDEEDDQDTPQPEELAASKGVQTAEVRDQGGRVMHRTSRRMRRRRGGSRFSRETQSAVAPSVESGDATAIATGLETSVVSEPKLEPARFQAADERSMGRPERVLPSITDLLKPGQEIIVQIAKEPLGQKGARITSHIALPGRYVVFMPSVNHLGVSRKIASDEERQRLKRILQAHQAGTTGGFIVRTAGEGIPEDEIAADMNFLYSLWLDIRQKAEKKPAPMLLHYDLDVVQRILRDQVTEDFKAIWVDNEEMYESVLSFMHRFQPALVNRVKMYTRSAPVFDAFNITQELEKALRPKVWLKSGGYIVINQTEALVAIDINTGKYVGRTGRLEDTIVKTNTEAVKEIVRQIRLRDLGGIIVVDFIDMDERKNRQKVMQALEECMQADKAPYKILQFNDFGLVAITRKRVKQSLERTLCAPCPYCEGAGYVKSVQTIIGEILVEAQKIARAIDGKDVMLRVHPDVAKILKASDNKYLEEMEEILGKPVMVKGDPTLHHEKFDLA